VKPGTVGMLGGKLFRTPNRANKLMPSSLFFPVPKGSSREHFNPSDTDRRTVEEKALKKDLLLHGHF